MYEIYFISKQHFTNENEALHINSMRNIAVRYEYIENAHVNNIVTFKNKTVSLKELIMIVKHNGSHIFMVAE